MPASGQLVEHQAQREDVGGGGDRLGARLLGRHVPGRAQEHARVRDAATGDRPAAGGSWQQPDQAEVEHLDVAVGADHQVLGLDVAVDDARGVGRSKRRGHLPDQRQEPGQVGVRARQRPQRLPLDPFQDQERPAPVFANAVKGADGRVIQRRGGARLAPEPCQGARVARRLLWEELQGHDPAQPGVMGLVDDAHAPFTEHLQDLVPLRRRQCPLRSGAQLGVRTGAKRLLPVRSPRSAVVGLVLQCPMQLDLDCQPRGKVGMIALIVFQRRCFAQLLAEQELAVDQLDGGLKIVT